MADRGHGGGDRRVVDQLGAGIERPAPAHESWPATRVPSAGSAPSRASNRPLATARAPVGTGASRFSRDPPPPSQAINPEVAVSRVGSRCSSAASAGRIAPECDTPLGRCRSGGADEGERAPSATDPAFIALGRPIAGGLRKDQPAPHTIEPLAPIVAPRGLSCNAVTLSVRHSC